MVYFVSDNTLIEEHIIGIPASDYLKNNTTDSHFDETRLAKEFVKFNERCFVRLLGDTHSSNFVIDVTPDFEETHYRMRSIDFDQ
jgi:predicted unusual protein kinase regulating ubiquinone biosynthesis (AarF/ABC1/UbiB family)